MRTTGPLEFPAASQATTRTRVAGPAQGMRTTPARFTSRRNAWPSIDERQNRGLADADLRAARPGRMRIRGGVESATKGTPNEIAPTSAAGLHDGRVLAVAQQPCRARTVPHEALRPGQIARQQRARDPPSLTLDADTHVRRRGERERQREAILAAVAVRRERQRRDGHEAERAVHAQRDELLNRDPGRRSAR